MMMLRIQLGLMVTILLSCCVPAPVPEPEPVRAPPPPAVLTPVAPPVQQPPPPPATEWADMPLSPGSWTYDSAGPAASFGTSPTSASLVLRCDRQRRAVAILRNAETSGNTMIVRTTSGARTLPLSVEPVGPAAVYGSVPASDPFLDGIAFSRGRISIEVPGAPRLILPAWAEPARVVDECRS